MENFDDLDPMAATNLAERLIKGDVEPSDAPAGLGAVAHLIRTAQGPGAPDELGTEATTVAAFIAQVQAQQVAPTRRRATVRVSKIVTRVVAVAAPIFVAGGVAAAAGALPPSAQAPVARALAHLGISVPNPQADHPSPTASAHSGTNTTTGSNTGASPANRRLCTAWMAGAPNDHSTAYRNLAAAGGTAKLSAYCSGMLTTSTTGTVPGGGTATLGHPGAVQGATPNSVSGGPKAANPAVGHNPGAAGTTKSGLCSAWAAGGLDVHSTAYRNLSAAAGGAGNIAAYCGVSSPASGATSPGTTVSPQGSPTTVPGPAHGPSTQAGHGGPPPSPPGQAGKAAANSAPTKPPSATSPSRGNNPSCAHPPVGSPGFLRHCSNPVATGGSVPPPGSVHHPATPPGLSRKPSHP